MARRYRERNVFLPWEAQGSLLRRLGLSRARPFVVLSILLLGFGLLVARERRQARIRSTHATILVARRGIDAYRADSGGECPKKGLEELVSRGYLRTLPHDAWGRPLQLVCPARHQGRAYELYSDGPDGEPEGLDRVE